MSSKEISGEHCREPLPSIMHGLGTWLSIVAIPTSEPGNDPAEKTGRVWRVRVFLLFGGALEFARQALQGFEEALVDEVGNRPLAAVSGVDQLHGSDGGGEADGGQLEQAISVVHLRLFQAEPVLFESTEDLLDPPAHAVEVDDLHGM